MGEIFISQYTYLERTFIMNNYNGKNKNFNNKPRMTDEEYAAHKAQLIEKQTKSLDIINDTCTFLEKAIADTNVHRVSMKDVLA